MSWFKLVSHDLRNGLLRWRYFAAAVIIAIPCYTFWKTLSVSELTGSWMDYMMYLFLGKEPLTRMGIGEQFDLPIMWLLVLGTCLLLNMDYLLKDLTYEGLQYIVRSGSRKGWFLSKCIWNFCSCCLYFCMISLVAFLFVFCTNGRMSTQNTPAVSLLLFGFEISNELTLSAWESITSAIVIPFVTMLAFSLLEMTLCLMVKPAVSILVCLSLMVLSVYLNEPYILGNGAMTIRSALIADSDGISPAAAVAVAVSVIAGSIIVGALRFRHTDILGSDE